MDGAMNIIFDSSPHFGVRFVDCDSIASGG